jgi:hypothetical protein
VRRRIFGRLSIAAGNAAQIAGIAAAYFALVAARSTHSSSASIVAMVAAWILLYFCCHAIAHWAVGRILGIRFAFYTVGGTGNPEGWPRGVRWFFEHLPFLGVQTEKTSMQRASPIAKSDHVVGGGDVFRRCADVCCVLLVALRRPGEQVVLAFCAGLGGGSASQQLDKPHRRLRQGEARFRGWEGK